jgi:hypothetical protein
MHDILILTEPVELVGMLKSQLKCDILILWTSGVGGNAKITTNARYLNSHWTSGVGGNAKITNAHDILILTEPVGWWEC